MSHTPSVPLSVERGDWEQDKKPVRKCIECGATLPQSEQNGSDYYHCDSCGHSSLEYK
jgi:DNA-directed RNA polymerase subunit RPC12/RpoP